MTGPLAGRGRGGGGKPERAATGESKTRPPKGRAYSCRSGRFDEPRASGGGPFKGRSTAIASADCEEVKPELVGARDFRGLESAQKTPNCGSLGSKHAPIASPRDC